MLKWFTQQLCPNIPLSSLLLKMQAEHSAKLFGIREFGCFNGRVDRFILRYNICGGKIFCESTSVNKGNVKECIEKKQDYFTSKPHKTLKLKGEKCHGGKLSKDWTTVQLCANLTGSEKNRKYGYRKIKKFAN